MSDALVSAAKACHGLRLLLLFGSRTRGDARPGADWDYGYLADETADVPALVEALEDDRIDLVNLGCAGGLLRYRAARDGRLVHEAAAGLFDRYRLEAARFWCDNAPVLEPGYDEILESLPSVSGRARRAHHGCPAASGAGGGAPAAIAGVAVVLQADTENAWLRQGKDIANRDGQV